MNNYKIVLFTYLLGLKNKMSELILICIEKFKEIRTGFNSE